MIGFLSILFLLVILVFGFGVKGIVIFCLELYKFVNRMSMKLRGYTTATLSQQRIISGKSWDEFCDSLKAAGAVVMAPGAPRDPFVQAEGYRYLSRVLRGGLENFLESSDPQAPRFITIANGLRSGPVKLGSDNPDNLYENATIDGSRFYKIVGKRGTVFHLNFSVQAGQYGQPGGLRTVSSLEAKELNLDKEDRFVIIVGPQDRSSGDGVNYMKTVTNPSHGMIMLRQTFGDRRKEKAAECQITCLEGYTIPAPLTCEHLDNALASTTLFVTAATGMFAKCARDFQHHTNQLPLFDQTLSNSVGGDPLIRYYHSYWHLKDDEALVIKVKPPPCRTWNFQVNNYWMESLDYRYHRIHVNKFTAHYREDGSICIILTHNEPEFNFKVAAYDYLTTDHHNHGTMTFRYVVPEVPDSQLPQPQTRVVKIKDLGETL